MAISITVLPRNWLVVDGCSRTVTDPCLSAVSAQRWWGLFLRTHCCQASSPLGINYYRWSNTKSNAKCIPWSESFSFSHFDCLCLTYGCMLAQGGIFSNVTQYETIPCILPGEIPFAKLSLSQTFTNTELTQPRFSPSLCVGLSSSLKLLDPMALRLSGRGHCRKSVLVSIASKKNDICKGLFRLRAYTVSLTTMLHTRNRFSGMLQGQLVILNFRDTASDDEAWLIMCGYQRREGYCMRAVLRSVMMLSVMWDSFHFESTGYYLRQLFGLSVISSTL